VIQYTLGRTVDYDVLIYIVRSAELWSTGYYDTVFARPNCGLWSVVMQYTLGRTVDYEVLIYIVRSAELWTIRYYDTVYTRPSCGLQLFNIWFHWDES